MHLRSGVTKFFCNSPDSKYFSLCGNNSVGAGKALTDLTWTNRHGCVLMFYSTWAAITKLTGWLINNRNALLHSGGCQVQDQGVGWFSVVSLVHGGAFSLCPHMLCPLMWNGWEPSGAPFIRWLIPLTGAAPSWPPKALLG